MLETGFTLNTKVYDVLKFVALVLLPAAATLVAGLGLTLNWTDATTVVGILTLVDTFLGAILKRSSINYAGQQPEVIGDLIAMQDPDGTPAGFKMVGSNENQVFVDGTQVVLNVRREQRLE